MWQYVVLCHFIHEVRYYQKVSMCLDGFCSKNDPEPSSYNNNVLNNEIHVTCCYNRSLLVFMNFEEFNYTCLCLVLLFY